MSDSHSSPGPPLRRRPRVSLACLACQQKKQRCDGQTPACRQCLRANRECISQDPSTKRRHPRGYLESLEKHNASLEQHIAFLENRMREVLPNVDLDLLTSSSAGMLSRRRDGPAHEDECQTPSTHDGDDFSNLELLCLRAAGGDPHYFGESSGYSLTKLFSATLRGVRAQAPGLTMAGLPSKLVQARPTPTPVPLPDRSVTTMLTAAYFDQVHPQFPFLHRPTFLQWEEEVLTAVESGYSPDPVHLFFLYAVAAVGALTGPLAGASLPEGLYASAENLFEKVMKLSTLESIQAILCCAMYSMRSPVGISVWTLSGLALRQCIEMGLHRKIPWFKVELNMLKTQMRRRVFWCAYNLDRAVAITLGRPVGITDSDIDVELPLDINDENITVAGLLAEPRVSNSEPTTTVSAAIHTIRVRHIWTRIQSLVYPQRGGNDTPGFMSSMLIEGFKMELKDWRDSAPEQLQSNRAHNNAFGGSEWFNLMYHHSILLLHRHNLVLHSSRTDETTPGSTFLESAHSAESICSIYRQLYLSQRLNDTWGALHVLFLGGVTFLYCLWTSPETRVVFRLDKVSATCTSCMVVLAVMAERWAAVQPYRDAFDMLSRATQTMLAELETSMTVPAMPVLSSSTDEQLTGFLANITEVGMCSSVEVLLSSMIN
ncbi:transcriptional regulatory protein GAL4 [Thozetella sp. PMI_491]|nr:transcriptional regulatory protein GAL4 [Thozetella sp. PMI_491]